VNVKNAPLQALRIIAVPPERVCHAELVWVLRFAPQGTSS